MEVPKPPAKRRKITSNAGHRPVTRASLARAQQDNSALPAYTYRALKEEDEIRIFKVEKTGPSEWRYNIEHTTLRNAPPFETVSYVWGPDTRRNILRLQDNRTIRINDNLAQALPYLSAECKTGHLWIDQININQSSTHERNHQVRIMGKIYKKGKRVIAWLGKEEEPSKQLLALVEVARSSLELGESSSLIREKIESELLKLCPRDLLVITRVLGSQWFSRAWVFQEIVLSKHAAFLFGDVVVPFLALVWICKVSATPQIRIGAQHCQISSSNPVEDPTQLASHLEMVSTQSYRTLSVMHHSWYAVSCGHDYDRPFTWRLSRISPLLQTADLKDSVYAFLGLQTSRHTRIHADYNLSYEGTLIKAATTIIRDMQSLEILSYCERESGSYLSKRLPSWVPEWKAPISAPLLVRDYNSRYILPLMQSYLMPCDIEEPRKFDELKVRGVRLDTISTCFAPEYRFRAKNWYEEDLEEYLALDERRDLVQRYAICSRERLLGVLLTRPYCPDIDFKDFHGTSEDYSTMELLKEYDEYRDTHDKIQGVRGNKNLGALRYLTYLLDNRQLFLTKDGHLGHVRRPAKGDMICFLQGFEHIIVLRPCGNNRFTLVGTCHVEGQLGKSWQLGPVNGRCATSFWGRHEGEEFVLV